MMSTMNDIGILAQIPRGCLSPVDMPLPDPATCKRGEMRQMVVEAAPFGRVRVSYRLLTHNPGGFTVKFWNAYHAEQTAADTPLGEEEPIQLG